MGFNAIDSQGLTAPPFFCSFLVTIFSTWVADKTQQRGLTIMVLTTIGGIGYVLLATVKTVGVRYFGTFLAASGIFPSKPCSIVDPNIDFEKSNTYNSRYRKHPALGPEYALNDRPV